MDSNEYILQGRDGWYWIWLKEGQRREKRNYKTRSLAVSGLREAQIDEQQRQTKHAQNERKIEKAAEAAADKECGSYDSIRKSWKKRHSAALRRHAAKFRKEFAAQ